MTPEKRILLVDANVMFRHALAEQVRLYETVGTEEAGTGAEALAFVSDSHFDVILLENTLPDTDGLALCREMRRDGVRSPVILFVPAGGTVDGLESGITECLSKPFRLGVLLARLRSLTRQVEQIDDTVHIPVGVITCHAPAIPMGGPEIALGING